MYVLRGVMDEVTELVGPDLRGRQRCLTFSVEAELALTTQHNLTQAYGTVAVRNAEKM